MMKHRKNIHKEMVKTCNKFLRNECNLKDKFCWFIHKDEGMEADTLEKQNESKDNQEEAVKFESVFQTVLGNLKPPILKEHIKQKME